MTITPQLLSLLNNRLTPDMIKYIQRLPERFPDRFSDLERTLLKLAVQASQ